MRSGMLRLVGVALAATILGATGCDDSPGGSDQARTETGTQVDSGSAAPAPQVGVSGGTAAGADTAARSDTTATPTTATPSVDARADTAPTPPRADTSRRARPSAGAAAADTAPSAPRDTGLKATTARRDAGGTTG